MTDRQQFVRVCACGCGQPTLIARQSKGATKRGQPQRFITRHQHPQSALPQAERFWGKVDAAGVCWEFTSTPDKKGYCYFKTSGPEGRANCMAHRWAWEYLIGPIPPGMTLDHRCRNKKCVCPDHLEVVTRATNTRRGYGPSSLNSSKERCKHGHAFDAQNTILVQRPGRAPWRECRACKYARNRIYRHNVGNHRRVRT